jgi:hypothetical protein
MSHIAPLSFKVATTLAAQRIVAMSAADTVAYPAAGNLLPVGITADTVLDTNQAIPVYGAGNICKLLFDDTVAAAGLVSSDSSGRGIPHVLAATTTSLTLAAAYVGILSGEAVAATGTIANVYIQPGLVK